MNNQLVIPMLIALVGGWLFSLQDDAKFYEIPFLANTTNRILGRPDRTKVRVRLTQIGRENEYESFRLKQLVTATAAGSISIALGYVVSGSTSVAAIFSAATAMLAFAYVDRKLTRDVKLHRARLESEFAPVVEMLTLSLSAGETPLGAMNRIADRSDGVLAKEFGRVVAEVRDGAPFHSALDSMGFRTDCVVIRRFVDALITAMLRGAPLVDVLQRHALEARSTQRNVLLDKAGKAEISMMIPVVFLILPISVLFALWPSVTNLNLFAT